MPITQEKLEHEYRSCSIILSLISVSHSSVFVQLTHTCRQTNPSNCGMIPLAAPLGAPTRSRALWVRVFHNSSKHSRQACFFLPTQPARLLCDREANLLRQNTLPSRHATLASFHQPAYYIRISLHACHNNTFTTNECGAFCPKLAVTCLSKGHK